MKRLRRWLFNLAVGVSLTLSLLAIVLSVRSYWVGDWIGWQNSSGMTSCGDLLLSFAVSDDPVPMFPRLTYDTGLPRSQRDSTVWGVRPTLARFGFAYFISGGPNNYRDFTMMVPLWFISLIASAVPVRWVWLYRGRWRRERWREAGLCPQCGYDLRATPDRCPECGMVAEAAKGADA